MNLVSCENCGAVIDRNKIRFPEESGSADEEDLYPLDKFVYTYSNHRKDKTYIAFVICPVCKEGKILEEG